MKKYKTGNMSKKYSVSRLDGLSKITTLTLLITVFFQTTVFAAGSDPLTIVNNLSEFIFSCIKAVGAIILGWGIVQVGISMQSHDASQRTQGFLCLLGGLLIAFAKEILTTIGAM